MFCKILFAFKYNKVFFCFFFWKGPQTNLAESNPTEKEQHKNQRLETDNMKS